MTWLSELRTWKYNGIQINRLCLYDEWSYVLQNVRHEYFYPFVRAKCYLQKLWIGNISRLPHAQETRDNKIQHIVNVHNQDADNASILFPGDKLACCFICIDFFKYVFKLFWINDTWKILLHSKLLSLVNICCITLFVPFLFFFHLMLVWVKISYLYIGLVIFIYSQNDFHEP